MSSLKLGVEVVSAYDLLAKDGQGSSDPCVELEFDGQRFRTTTKEKDLNPVWNESFYFNVSDSNKLSSLPLEAYVYSHNKANNAKTCLGKVRLTSTSFVPYSDAVVLHYPLEKRTVFSRAKGELGLKVFVTDDPSIKSSTPLPAMESSLHSDAIPNSFPKEKNGKRHTFFHLPNAKQSEQQQKFPPMPPQQQMNYGVHEMKSGPPPSRAVHMFPGSSSQPLDYALKETSPFLGGGRIVGGRVIRGDRPTSTYDLVEQMRFLFVRVVKARDLPSKDATGSLDPYVEVKLGNYKGITKHYEKKQNPEWNQVFAFSRDTLQSSVLEVVVKDKDLMKDDSVGFVRFDLNEVPTRVPPDSPLAPEWYRLEDKKGEKKKGELMLAVWYGTQADEAFPDAWHSDAIAPGDSTSVSPTYIRSKVYHSPRLWYVRVNILEAQDLVPADKNRFPDAYVKVQIGNQILKTKSVQNRNMNPIWNEEFMFVAAEPFEDHLIFSVEDRVGPNKDDAIGKVVISLNSVDRRADDRTIRSRWYNLEKSFSDAVDDRAKKDTDKFRSRLHVCVCLDGGYHVLDESTQYSSDLRPTAKQLWKPSIGVLELGILNANGIQPMKTREGKGTTDTYCVAKYGHKWVRTRTIVNSLNPKYNEQYTWEVYDPATVLTVGVFDNSQIGSSDNNRDTKIGKVRIRISTLETGRVYTHTYPLLVLHPSGVKKLGELHLAIRFSSTSMLNMMFQYSRPLLPKMHYKRPLSVIQQDILRHQAVNIVAARLGRAEPPLRREVVEYMSDANAHLWSMRRSKANFLRLTSVFSGLFAAGKWFGEVCMWRNPITTVLVHVLFAMLVCFPELILPTVFLYMFLIGVWNYRYRPRYPPHMNTSLSCSDAVSPDELDEEFETFPATKSSDIVRMRYDRLRSVAGRIQTVVGDIASQGERLQALLSWRDPRATTIFVILCLVAAIVLYVTPFQVIALLSGFYVLRHPRFRHKTPSPPINFFRRLPARTDSML
ncbi:multiple C2 domain and transmembrane region protein 7 [Hibiscus trionum]|uniref:Multiple C2 domain and transmembrane region protein 7 n=1 Tax=Hibiscus trionum TaxID=183268 RepID=A0A9W7HED3_HIBTR|nr:multiple C2 domain and transmembrane region protein 7 [Hibiscus trionum]